MQIKTSFLGHSFTKLCPNTFSFQASGNPLMPRSLSLGGELTKQFFVWGEPSQAVLRSLINLLNQQNKLTICFVEAADTNSVLVEKPVQISNIYTQDVFSANGKSKIVSLVVAPFFKSYFNIGSFVNTGLTCTINFLCEILDNELQEVDSVKTDCILSNGAIIEPTLNAFDTQQTYYFSLQKSLCGLVKNAVNETVCFNNHWQGEQTITDGPINFSSYYQTIEPSVFTFLQTKKSDSQTETTVTGEELLQTKKDLKYENRFWTHEHDGQPYMHSRKK